MLKVILSGCNGAMGQVITKFIESNPDIHITAGFDRNPDKFHNSYPVYNDLSLCHEEANVIIDFSHHHAFEHIVDFALQRKFPLVMATTGLTAENKERLLELSTTLPIFHSANMSLGVNVVLEIVQKISKVLEDSFDIEIIEKHHNKKADAPSGTALMLAEGIDQSLKEDRIFVYGRHTKEDHRGKKDIGIHAIRGGTIVGEHTVLYAGNDEIIEIKHRALSKNIFAAGAIKAAQYILGKEKGYYNMGTLLEENK
ncbi:4-hydroxy-tetrahydrodipicolinate reductase [Irregularibacter muris]|uniref:4-hydroxy-tetrahydrodipicolinate reductase n=1 Tax=Irregularibacter muris TaxID=1796619 RepID=A0AAE3HHZ5_9FIRM|nr:4-hydroxy-tetrahydrodipicolinate reductase [Irregularibacter muris]MCR1899784.1 4-hydroxy-tetrahydrodipicolinate reductase [Irregularibacter muris]